MTSRLASFCEFNALRKNQLLAFYEELAPLLQGCVGARRASTKYRDYYFLPQFEAGQQELVELHHYTYEVDLHAMMPRGHDKVLSERVRAINAVLLERCLFSTQRQADYDKMMSTDQFKASKRYHEFFLQAFLSPRFFSDFAGLGFSEINPKEKEINSLTQTVFYSSELMSRQAWRMEYEFEKECVNQMAKSTCLTLTLTPNPNP